MNKINIKNKCDEIKQLELSKTINNTHIQELNNNYDKLEYEKLIIEEKYLLNEEELDNYKTEYIKLVDRKKKLEYELNDEIKNNNFMKNKLNILNNKYDELFTKFNNLNTINNEKKLIHNMLNTNNIKCKIEDIINNILKNSNNITVNKNILQNMSDNIINKIKNELSFLKNE